MKTDGGAGITVVTNGARGIGRAIVQRVAMNGDRVAAICQSADVNAQELMDWAAESDFDVSVHRTDLSSFKDCRATIAEIVAQRGRVSRLVNNAGPLAEAKVSEQSHGDWATKMDSNLWSAFFLAETVWDSMVASGFGRIVNLGSVAVAKESPAETASASSKTGIIGLTRFLALAGARRGVTVNCVVPGEYVTDNAMSRPRETRARIAALTPVGRSGHPDEIAHIVVALLGELAGYVTGAVVMADGGLSMTSEAPSTATGVQRRPRGTP